MRACLPKPFRLFLRRCYVRLITIGLDRSERIAQPEEETAASGEMSIVVAVHDAPQVLARCLWSLEAYAPRAEVILVDDASKLDETKTLLRDYAERNGWILIRHEASRGHSRACETGGKAATRPYICLLNSDTLVTPWCWASARKVLESEPDIAVAGPTTSWASTIQVDWNASMFRHEWSNRKIVGYAKRFYSNSGSTDYVELPYPSGFGFFIRRKVWEDFGGFDPNLPDYGNETELCKRLAEAGLRCVWIPSSYIHHFGEQSYAGSVPWKRRMEIVEYIRKLRG